MPTTILIYTLLLLTTTLYALILDRHKERWEPDWTWAEVAIGILLCLTAPATTARLTPGHTWASYETHVIAAFIVGGTPIILWRLHRTLWMREQALHYARRHHHGTAPLAQERGGSPH